MLGLQHSLSVPAGGRAAAVTTRGPASQGAPPLHQEFHQSLYPTPSGEQPIVSHHSQIMENFVVVLFHCCMSLTNLVNAIFTSSRIRLCITIISNDIEHL